VHYVHLMVPHAPWTWLPDGRSYARYAVHPHGMVRQSWRGTEWETTQAHQRHLLSVGYADHLLGELLDTLERIDRFDDTLIVVTSDHGSTFETGVLRRNVRGDPIDDLVSVPLIVKYPGQREGGVDDRNTDTTDILPSILDVLGIELVEEIAELVGLGPGLTPSGDDLLGGAMIALQALGVDVAARALADRVLARARTGTSAISSAHLSAAAEGSGALALHQAITALARGDACRLRAALDRVGRVGATSGWDGLAGAVLVFKAYAGARTVIGFNSAVMGALNGRRED